jgi:hypothetical protein
MRFRVLLALCRAPKPRALRHRGDAFQIAATLSVSVKKINSLNHHRNWFYFGTVTLDRPLIRAPV